MRNSQMQHGGSSRFLIMAHFEGRELLALGWILYGFVVGGFKIPKSRIGSRVLVGKQKNNMTRVKFAQSRSTPAPAMYEYPHFPHSFPIHTTHST